MEILQIEISGQCDWGFL